MSAEDVGLFEALYTTRALRRYTTDPVPDDVLFQVIDAAIRAPAGGNAQIWHFLIVRDEAKRQRIGELYLKTWKTYGKQFLENPDSIDQLPRQMQLVVRSTDHLARHFAEAPVHLFVCGPEQSQGTVYPAMQNLLLACRGVGLASVITMFHRPYPKELGELLGIPEGQVAHGLLPIGWPSDKIGPVSRIPVHKVASLDSWGSPWEYAQQQPEEGLRKKWVGK
jgi:nitroreductase